MLGHAASFVSRAVDRYVLGSSSSCRFLEGNVPLRSGEAVSPEDAAREALPQAEHFVSLEEGLVRLRRCSIFNCNTSASCGAAMSCLAVKLCQ